MIVILAFEGKTDKDGATTFSMTTFSLKELSMLVEEKG